MSGVPKRNDFSSVPDKARIPLEYTRGTTQAWYSNRVGTVFEPHGCGMENI